jgi:hypothetical protein
VVLSRRRSRNTGRQQMGKASEVTDETERVISPLFLEALATVPLGVS